MPRKKLEDLEPIKVEKPKADAEVVVPASSTGATKKVKLDLEVDTSVKDLGLNLCKTYPVKAVDSWRIFTYFYNNLISYYCTSV